MNEPSVKSGLEHDRVGTSTGQIRLASTEAEEANPLSRALIISMGILSSVFLGAFFSDSMGQQANVFFLKTSDYMMDLYNNVANSAQRNFYHIGEVDRMAEEHLYPPLAYLILYPLSKTSNPPSLAMATSAFFWFLICALFLLLLYDAYRGRKSYKLGVALSMVFSGLFICSFERGNLAILAAVLCGFFVFNYSSSNRTTRELALVALSVAVALKAYPIVLGALLLFDRRYREAIRVTTYSIAAVFVPFFFVNGGFANVPIWIRNIGLNSDAYEFRQYPRFGFRYFLVYATDFSPGMASYLLLEIATLIFVLLAIATAVFHVQRWKRIAQLVLCIMLFPVNSGIYTGLLLFPAIVLFLNSADRTRKDWIYLFLFVLILNPIQYVLGNGMNLNLVFVNLAAYAVFILLVIESSAAVIKRYGFYPGRIGAT